MNIPDRNSAADRLITERTITPARVGTDARADRGDLAVEHTAGKCGKRDAPPLADTRNAGLSASATSASIRIVSMRRRW